MHADGNWKTEYTPHDARLLASELNARPSLIRKLLKLGDPIVSNITYAAIEINKADD